MIRHIKYTVAQRELAGLARKMTMNRNVLYHGTRYCQSILKTGILFRAEIGGCQVCLTRSPEVAAYWALMERDDDEGYGSILIFDRQSLEARYKIKCNTEVFWLTDTIFHDEAEEEIFDDVIDIGDHLIKVVSGPTVRRSHRHRILNREHRRATEARLQQYLGKNRPEFTPLVRLPVSNREASWKTHLQAARRPRRGR